jgi:putative NIF3 family GTP cyclohydrolase 1 type 2
MLSGMTPIRSVLVACVTLLSAAAAQAQAKTPAQGQGQPQPLTARQVIERIQKNVGVPWTEPTVDTFKAGDPDTPITGVAVTMMATLDVLQRAAAAGRNLIITHEPTFYGHLDQTTDLAQENDAVYLAKQAFIKEHRLVIWRFHDYWHRRRPDGIMTGMVAALGWQPFQNADNPSLFQVPATTLDKLAADMKQRLNAAVVRVVGDRQMKVSKIGLAPGASGYPRHRRLLQQDAVEVLVIGEAQEWETVEYVADAISAKKPKALIMLGHIPSEQAGMSECAHWLKTFVTEVPVEFVPARDPFWRPE